MQITVFIFLLILSASIILYGKRYAHLEFVMIGFAFTFLLGLSVAGSSAFFSPGISYQSGFSEAFTYDNSTLVSSVTTYTYETFTSVFLGSWLAITSALGFLAPVFGGKIWGRKD